MRIHASDGEVGVCLKSLELSVRQGGKFEGPPILFAPEINLRYRIWVKHQQVIERGKFRRRRSTSQVPRQAIERKKILGNAIELLRNHVLREQFWVDHGGDSQVDIEVMFRLIEIQYQNGYGKGKTKFMVLSSI